MTLPAIFTRLFSKSSSCLGLWVSLTSIELMGLPSMMVSESTCTVHPVDSAPIAIARWSVPTRVTFCGSLSSACKQTQHSVRIKPILARAMRIPNLLFSPIEDFIEKNGLPWEAALSAQPLFPVTPNRIRKRAISRHVPHRKPRPRPAVERVHKPRVLVIVECRRRLQINQVPVGVYTVAPHHLSDPQGKCRGNSGLDADAPITLRGH